MNIYDVALTQNSPENGFQACHVIGLREKIKRPDNVILLLLVLGFSISTSCINLGIVS